MMTPDTMQRREFVLTASAFALTPSLLARAQDAATVEEIPAITLGRTGRVLPRLGFGGYPIVRVDEDEGIRVVRRAIDAGVRYLDTAPSYGSGRSEERIGEAVAQSGVPREEFFIATKTLRRDGRGARRELEESLERLGVAYVDSVQVHEVHDDVESIFGPDAVLKALEKARDEGLVRHIGVTAHRNPVHAITAIRRYDFVTALVPINPLDTKHRSFIRTFLPVARERNVAVIAMKIYGGGSMLAEGRFRAPELVRYALSQPQVAIAVPGCGEALHVDEALEGARGFTPLGSEALAALEERAGEHRGKASEWYKDG